MVTMKSFLRSAPSQPTKGHVQYHVASSSSSSSSTHSSNDRKCHILNLYCALASMVMMTYIGDNSLFIAVEAVTDGKLYMAPHEVTYGFCEEFMPGVSHPCCSALSGVRISHSTHLDMKINKRDHRVDFAIDGLSEEFEGGRQLSTWALSEMAYASGKRLPFDVGHFNHCKNIKDSRFFLATVSTPDRGMAERLLEVGICAPKHCSPTDLYNLLKNDEDEDAQLAAVSMETKKNKMSESIKSLLCANPLWKHTELVDCFKRSNTTSISDLSILGTKSIANAIVSHLTQKHPTVPSDNSTIKLEVVSSDTDLRKIDVLSHCLQYCYLIFLALLIMGAWAEKIMGWETIDDKKLTSATTSTHKASPEPEGSPLLTQVTSTTTTTHLWPRSWSMENPTFMGHRILFFTSCFSIPSNFRKLRAVPPETETDCLNGMRVITMIWIIIGHTMLMPAAIAGYDNEGDLVASWGYRGTFVLQSILGAEVGVDTFFFLSGFLTFRLSPLLSKLAQKTKSILVTTILASMKRYIRLTPSLVFVMLIYFKILPYYGAGPFVVRFQKSVFRRCDKLWWTQLLYIQNFYPFDSDEVCMGWSWYLGNDMCFFLVSPIILIMYEKSKRMGWAILIALFTASTAITCYLIYYFNLGLYIYDQHFQDYAYWAYSKPYTRIGAYLVGLGAAFFYSENYKYLHRLNHIYYKIASLLSALVMAVIVFAVAFNFNVPNSWGLGVCMLYLGFARQAWAFANAVITISCAVGALPWINRFLSMHLWVPFARLCYGAYLIHPVVIKFVAANVTNYYHFSPADTLYRSIVNTLSSFCCATVIYLAFERPIMTLESRLSTRTGTDRKGSSLSKKIE